GDLVAFLFTALILLPLSFVLGTRKFASMGLLIASFIFGASTWLIGFTVTYDYWGILGVIIGIVMGIVGIVPLGMIASLLHSDWVSLAFLCGGLVLTYGARMSAFGLAEKIDRDAEKRLLEA